MFLYYFDEHVKIKLIYYVYSVDYTLLIRVKYFEIKMFQLKLFKIQHPDSKYKA